MGFKDRLRQTADIITNLNKMNDKGFTGELLSSWELDKHFDRSLIFRNIYLQKRNGMTTEIDLLVVAEQGVVVIESKNYSGIIYGKEDQKQWTQYFSEKKKYSVPNPISQNNSHIKALKLALNDYPDLTYFSVIVFSERCTLKIGEVTKPNTYVIQRFDLDKTIDKIRDEKPALSADKHLDILARLKKPSKPKKEIQKKHIEDIKTKCQFCASPLVERTAKENGNKFLGCSTFPKCRFTKQI